jgi:hypothetical protein
LKIIKSNFIVIKQLLDVTLPIKNLKDIYDMTNFFTFVGAEDTDLYNRLDAMKMQSIIMMRRLDVSLMASQL